MAKSGERRPSQFEVNALDKEIGGDKRRPSRMIDPRGIVADANPHGSLSRSCATNALDQPEFSEAAEFHGEWTHKAGDVRARSSRAHRNEAAIFAAECAQQSARVELG